VGPNGAAQVLSHHVQTNLHVITFDLKGSMHTVVKEKEPSLISSVIALQQDQSPNMCTTPAEAIKTDHRIHEFR
jgi:hypothetical protein